MLNSLILENFKAFGGRRVIPIRPLTLMFGPNSAGKSAILQALLLLRQTISDEETGEAPLRLKAAWLTLAVIGIWCFDMRWIGSARSRRSSAMIRWMPI